MEFEDRASTSSSFSGIYRNILQSPAPICMYYFSHPFGISTPQNHKQDSLVSTVEKSIKTPNNNNNNKLQNLIIHNNKRRYIETELRLTPLIPWPRDIWSRQDYDLPPLLQVLAQKNGHQLPDIETIIKTVRNAWNTPNLINKPFYKHNMSLTKSNLDIFNNTNNNNKIVINNKKLINKNYLLKRRYSVPEIIMRKHSIDQLKINENLMTINEQKCFTKVNTFTTGILKTAPTRTTTATNSSKSLKSSSSTSSSRTTTFKNKNKNIKSKLIYTNGLIENEKKLQNEKNNINEQEIIENIDENLNNNIEIDLNNYENIDLNTTTVETIPTATETETVTATTTSTSTIEPEATLSTITSEIIINNLNNIGSTTTTTTTAADTEIESLKSDNKNKNLNKIKVIEHFLENKSDLYLDEFISNLLINNLNDNINGEILNDKTAKKLTKKAPSPSPSTPPPPETPEIENKQKIELIQVTTGSCYNLNNLLEPIFITRYSAIPRTQSMEVDIPSTTPSFGDEDDYYDFLLSNKNRNYHNMIHDRINYYINNSLDYRNYNMMNNHNHIHHLEDDDGSLSLIDSLDDPLSPRYTNSINQTIIPNNYNINTSNTKTLTVTSPKKYDIPPTTITDDIRETTATTIGAENEQNDSIINNKNEAFFISMLNDVNDIDNLQPPTPIEQIAYNVANIMPFKLRNKLQQRYNDINIKKEFNNNQKHIVFDIIGLDDDPPPPPLVINNQKRKTITTVKTRTTNKVKTKPFTNLSLLESYTIDSKGNMKFNNPDNKRPDTKITLKKTQQSVAMSSSAHRTASNLSSNQGHSSSSIIVKKPINNKLNVEYLVKRSQTQQQQQQQVHVIKKQEQPQSTINKQKVLRSQQLINDVQQMTTQNNLTPDIECGPHRFYHKTEIKDGEKSIEILEIVECNVNENGRKEQKQKPTVSQASKQQKKHVKIQKSITQELSREQQLQNDNVKSKIPVPVSFTNRTPNTINNNNNKPQLTPKNLMNYQQYQSPIKLHSQEELSPSPPDHHPMQRSGNLTKFHFFDVIPEERSSISVDSSNDDSSSLITSANNAYNDNNSSADTTNKREKNLEQVIDDHNSADVYKNVDDDEDNNNNNNAEEEEDELSEHNNTINDVTTNITPSSLTLSTISDYNLSLNSFNSDFNKPILKCYDNNNMIDKRTPPTSIITSPITTATSINVLTPNTLSVLTAELSTTTTAAAVTTAAAAATISNHNTTTLLLSSTMTTTTTTTTTSSATNYDNNNMFDYLTKINYCNDCLDNNNLLNNNNNNNNIINKNTSNSTNDNIWLVPDNNNLIINNKKKLLKSTKKLLLNNNNNNNNKNKIHSKSNFNENQIICHNLENYEQKKIIQHVVDDDNNNNKFLLIKQNELNCNLIKTKTYEINDETLCCMYCNINCHQNDNYDNNNMIICNLCKNLHNTNTNNVDDVNTIIDNKFLIKRPKHIYNLPRRCSIKSINKIIKDDIIIPKCKSDNNKIILDNKKNNKFQYYNKLKTIKHNNNNSNNNSYDDTSTSISPIQTESIDSDYEFFKRNKNLKQKYIEKHIEQQRQDYQEKLLLNNTNTNNKKKKNGWSVTVAGNYNTKIIPNVQMHLSFPTNTQKIKQNLYNDDLIEDLDDDDDVEHLNKNNNNNSSRHNRSLIKTENLNLPKMYDANKLEIINNNNNNKNSNSKKLIKLNKTKSSQQQQQQQKKIKSVECSLAMTSATTKTLTNINNHRRRTMSVHTFNTTESLKNRKKINDQSFDYSEVSSRRLSIDSQTPMNDTAMNLSVLGNSIAPEEKPRVPTMSERDLTRNLNSYFIRNRSHV